MSPRVFTADYIGSPGERTFYLQGLGGGGNMSFLVEKQQVGALAERLRELLLMIDQEDTIRSTAPARDPALAIDQPLHPEWRVGTMGLAYQEDEDQVIVLLQPVSEDDGDGDEETVAGDDDDDDSGVRFLLRRDQVRAFVLHAMAVVAEGRPLCQLCGLPMDPDGHVCPASNGHRVSG